MDLTGYKTEASLVNFVNFAEVYRHIYYTPM